MINFALLVHTLVLYDLANKVHKELLNNCPPVRPTLSEIGMPTYKERLTMPCELTKMF